MITSFLSTISLLNKVNFLFCLSKLKISFLFKDICVILIEKININERKKKNNKYILSWKLFSFSNIFFFYSTLNNPQNKNLFD